MHAMQGLSSVGSSGLGSGLEHLAQVGGAGDDGPGERRICWWVGSFFFRVFGCVYVQGLGGLEVRSPCSVDEEEDAMIAPCVWLELGARIGGWSWV